MVKIVCREEGLDPQGYTQVGTAEDMVEFPHVESCVAVALRVGEGGEAKWYVGHIAMGKFLPPDFSTADTISPLAKVTLDFLLMKLELAKVTYMVAYATDEWRAPLGALSALCGCGKYDWLINRVDGGGDLTINFSTGKLTVISTATRVEIKRTQLSNLAPKQVIEYTRPAFFRVAKWFESQFCEKPLTNPSQFFEHGFDDYKLEELRQQFKEWHRMGGKCVRMVCPMRDITKGRAVYHLKRGFHITAELELGYKETSYGKTYKAKKLKLTAPFRMYIGG